LPDDWEARSTRPVEIMESDRRKTVARMSEETCGKPRLKEDPDIAPLIRATTFSSPPSSPRFACPHFPALFAPP
jgi:hypothetical protein